MSLNEDPIFTDKQWEDLGERLDLPARQQQVIRQLFEGRGDKQIAAAIGVALPTVRSHLRRIYSRFDVQDRTELVLYIVREFIRMDGIHRDDIPQDDN